MPREQVCRRRNRCRRQRPSYFCPRLSGPARTGNLRSDHSRKEHMDMRSDQDVTIVTVFIWDNTHILVLGFR